MESRGCSSYLNHHLLSLTNNHSPIALSNVFLSLPLQLVHAKPFHTFHFKETGPLESFLNKHHPPQPDVLTHLFIATYDQVQQDCPRTRNWV
jgi:hypothetical protein